VIKRLVFVLPAGISLLAALDAGLFRLGWPLPLPQEDLPLAHGPLMVCGFLGTVISLEKAVALGARWPYLGVLATGIGGVLLVPFTGAPMPRLLIFLGSVSLAFVAFIFYRRERASANLCVFAGALSWATGNGVWLFGWPVYAVVPFWMGFLLLTIAGERLELNRLLQPSAASRNLFLICCAASLAGALLAGPGFRLDPNARILFTAHGDLLTSPTAAVGVRLSGIGFIGVALWLVLNDMARKALARPGLTRFIGTGLLLGYFWLGLSGILWVGSGAYVGGPFYDAVLHSFFLGFAFSMIFAHGPVIFPAILQRRLEFHPAFYAHLALLAFGLVLRVWGDLSGFDRGRAWGGLLNAVAIVLFIVLTASRVSVRGKLPSH
jgi:hypothetical protein